MIHNLCDGQRRGGDDEGADGGTGPRAGEGWVAAHSAASDVAVAEVEIAGEDPGVARQAQVNRATIGNCVGGNGTARQARVGAVQRVIGRRVRFDGRGGDR